MKIKITISGINSINISFIEDDRNKNLYPKIIQQY